jgi:DNA-binding MarR family transcriptional regulator
MTAPTQSSCSVALSEFSFEADLFGHIVSGQPACRADKPDIRATRRLADWRRQIARAFAYLMQSSPAEAEALWAEYERRHEEGPDWLHYHSKSEIKEAPKIDLDRNALARLKVKFQALARRAWEAKDKGKHRGLVSRAAEDVFHALMYLAAKYGRVFPSIKGLAYLARCVPSSVAAALDDLERLGFITRHRRRKRIKTPLGFKVVQDTSAYEVHEPRTALGQLAAKLFGKRSDSDFRKARGPSFFLNTDSDAAPGGAPAKPPDKPAFPHLRQALERLQSLKPRT